MVKFGASLFTIIFNDNQNKLFTLWGAEGCYNLNTFAIFDFYFR